MEGFAGRVFRFTSPAELSGFVTAIKKAAQKA
jgi:hypothetical protein